ncbi:MAG TPA: tRNA glutamyl-Q(34) synthetase GluQRS [Chthoniobacterales bacterium]|nr:tRNA glutamyl-Q(34) synthetase GluQRS [Chthoniobacterales bacterium]
MTPYRGRLAPSPTGYLHLGHAITFWRAQERARAAGGQLVLRIEDLDTARSRPEFCAAIIEDLQWFGLRWDEGPCLQSERRELHRAALEKLRASGHVYACTCSRRDVLNAAGAPHNENEEPIYPGTCRERNLQSTSANWRFRVPDGQEVEFTDLNFGVQRAIAGREFGDFLVWRKDDVPAYQLAVVVDDADMRITEVVRGADLLTSTFRQLLIYRALGWEPPEFYHVPLVTDARGRRLAKREDALSLRALRAAGVKPGLRASYL